MPDAGAGLFRLPAHDLDVTPADFTIQHDDTNGKRAVERFHPEHADDQFRQRHRQGFCPAPFPTNLR